MCNVIYIYIYIYTYILFCGSSLMTTATAVAARFLAQQTDPIYSSGRLHCRDSGPQEILARGEQRGGG